MLLLVLSLFLGLRAIGNAASVTNADGHRFLRTLSSLNETTPISPSDLVIVYTTTVSRLPLVHATRPARHGIRTFIVLQNASEAARLNSLYGGVRSEFNETYLAWSDAATFSARVSRKTGLFGRIPPPVTHSLHLIGPTWAMAPLLVHSAVLASSSTSRTGSLAAANTATASRLAGAVAAASSPRPPPPPPPYRWMLVARDDTLWQPRHIVRLLAQYDSGVAAAVSDHLIDFNGHELLAPSAAAAVCLPCGFDLVTLLGRRHPPGVPQPACPVCRPAVGCEFRFDLCGGLVGGPLCGTKRFLGSGDRCSHSWVAGGAGAALSVTLLSYLQSEDWAGCVRGQQPSTGERTLSRCLWRYGFSFTHPAVGVAERLTRDVFSDRHMLFGNPLLRQEIFGAQADALLGPAYQVEEAAATAPSKAAAATIMASAATATVDDGDGTAAAMAAVAVPASTRKRPVGAAECDQECRAWLKRSGVSAHLDVPYADGVDVAAAAAMLEKAAKGVAAATK